MFKTAVISALALTALVSGPALAQDDFPEVRAAVAKLAPNAEIASIEESTVPGMVEVTIGGQVVFISDDGRYLFQGTLFDIERRIDVTEERQAERRKAVLDNIDLDETVTFAADEPQHEIFVFTDIDCGYCRRMHDDIEGYLANGITIHYMGFPRAGIDSTSHDKLNNVWCSEDRQAALTRAKAGEDLEPKSCPTPVAEQYQLGRELGVTGTPALVTQAGFLLPGYLPPDQLLARLNGLASN